MSTNINIILLLKKVYINNYLILLLNDLVVRNRVFGKIMVYQTDLQTPSHVMQTILTAEECLAYLKLLS